MFFFFAPLVSLVTQSSMATFAALFFILDELCDEELESQILNECRTGKR